MLCFLFKHFINNRFIPLDEQKCHQSDEREVALYNEVQILLKKKQQRLLDSSVTSLSPSTSSTSSALMPPLSPASSTSSSRTMSKHDLIASSDSYLAFKQNKLHQSLTIRITNEEEKYVHLVKKLNEFSDDVS
jgi:hypothetical protein